MGIEFFKGVYLWRIQYYEFRKKIILFLWLVFAHFRIYHVCSRRKCSLTGLGGRSRPRVGVPHHYIGSGSPWASWHLWAHFLLFENRNNNILITGLWSVSVLVTFVTLACLVGMLDEYQRLYQVLEFIFAYLWLSLFIFIPEHQKHDKHSKHSKYLM